MYLNKLYGNVTQREIRSIDNSYYSYILKLRPDSKKIQIAFGLIDFDFELYLQNREAARRLEKKAAEIEFKKNNDAEIQAAKKRREEAIKYAIKEGARIRAKHVPYVFAKSVW